MSKLHGILADIREGIDQTNQELGLLRQQVVVARDALNSIIQLTNDGGLGDDLCVVCGRVARRGLERIDHLYGCSPGKKEKTPLEDIYQFDEWRF